MACINLGFLENLLIWLVVIGTVFALVKLLLPLILGPLGVAGTTVANALYIVLWCIVAIAVIILIFDLISCLIGIPRLR